MLNIPNPDQGNPGMRVGHVPKQPFPNQMGKGDDLATVTLPTASKKLRLRNFTLKLRL